MKKFWLLFTLPLACLMLGCNGDSDTSADPGTGGSTEPADHNASGGAGEHGDGGSGEHASDEGGTPDEGGSEEGGA